VLDPRQQVQLGAGGAGVRVAGGQLHLPVQHCASADRQVARRAARGQRAVAVGAAGRARHPVAAAAARPPLPHHPLSPRQRLPSPAQYLRGPLGNFHLLPGKRTRDTHSLSSHSPQALQEQRFVSNSSNFKEYL
jgi:hypothetical protein